MIDLSEGSPDHPDGNVHKFVSFKPCGFLPDMFFFLICFSFFLDFGGRRGPLRYAGCVAETGLDTMAMSKTVWRLKTSSRLQTGKLLP